MEEAPLLNLDQVEELATMVQGIQLANRQQLDDVLSETVDIHHTTIINLYNLTVEEWYNKQKVIDNLCHFTLTMMNTVQLLWEKRFEEEDKLNNAETAIEILQRNNGDLNEENENIKTKITEAEVEIMTAIGDKDRMEEFYRSSSCIGFYSENRIAKTESPEKCSACSDVESQLEKHKSQINLLSSRKIEEREVEISELHSQNKKLEEEVAELKEEHELTKLEVELAQIAIKEALSYKSSYMSMMSNMHEELSDIHERVSNKGSDVNEEGDLCPLNSHVLALECPDDSDWQEPEYIMDEYCLKVNKQSTMEDEKSKDVSNELSLVKMDTREDNKTTYQSPFRKKDQESPESEQNQDSFEESAINIRNSVVIYQSNVDFTLSSAHQNEKQPSFSDIHPSSRILCSSKSKRVNKQQPFAFHMKKETAKVKTHASSERSLNASIDETVQQNSVHKLYNFISTKLIKNRIRKG